MVDEEVEGRPRPVQHRRAQIIDAAPPCLYGALVARLD